MKTLTGKHMRLFLNGKEIKRAVPCSCPQLHWLTTTRGNSRNQLINVLHKLLGHTNSLYYEPIGG